MKCIVLEDVEFSRTQIKDEVKFAASDGISKVVTLFSLAPNERGFISPNLGISISLDIMRSSQR
jgi:hypothetical protein